MREAFKEIVSGWTLYSGLDDLTDKIERVTKWTEQNGPLEPDETATIELMIKAQIARGMPKLIRRLGLEREYGIPAEVEISDQEDSE